MITKEIVAEPFGGVTIVAMGAIDADVIETVQANERCLTPQPMLSHAGEDGLLIGTYYGHHNSSSELNGINLLHNDKWLTYEVVREILESNPRTFYGLD